MKWSTPMKLSSRLFGLFMLALASLPTAQAGEAAEAAQENYQLEPGNNVRVIDLGNSGIKDLSDAVKQLNAPRDPAPATGNADAQAIPDAEAPPASDPAPAVQP